MLSTWLASWITTRAGGSSVAKMHGFGATLGLDRPAGQYLSSHVLVHEDVTVLLTVLPSRHVFAFS
ncbi:hypothetical protein BCV70DRAFT_201300 [Testicularia cyperi]|uniref:Uncharacterized protein n=1 Tax=Testicularia cyperi TaxID=1882483 RepID=A0A317XP70_9BASI|nr:hypothetical protein BCV70DRAFT_201300 [Testicularia cyperi]